MAVDTPAKIAIIGAGPIGLEAALYARYLGYEVEVFEFQKVGHNVTAWEAQRMLTPFAQNSSSLGLAALKAHNPNYRPPAATATLTFGEWIERYLKPLSETDLIADHLRSSTVRMLGKVEICKTDCPSGDVDRGAWDFRLDTEHLAEGTERIATADVVLDCGGRNVGLIGHGGIAIPYESKHRFRTIEYRMHALRLYANKSVLVVGNDWTAAWMVTALVELMDHELETRVTWVTRHSSEISNEPFPGAAKDPLEKRRELLSHANELATSGKLRWWPGTWVEAVNEEGQLEVRVEGETEGTYAFDRILSQASYCPEWDLLTQELQLDICPITDAPRPFSEYLLKRESPYSIEYPAPDASALITSEPNYYVLGAKSFGRMPGFLYQHGLRQIRDVFTIIGDRATLDLYK